MRKIFIIFCSTLLILASDTLSTTADKKPEDKMVYTIQLFLDKNIKTAQKLLQKIPAELKSETHLYKAGNNIVARYSQSEGYSLIKPYLEKFHKAGFKDAFIVKRSSLFMEINQINLTNPKSVEQSKAEFLQEDTKKNISRFDKSALLIKAQDAYEKGDESEAMIYYEMLLSSKEASEKIKNNLCYLYGKRGAWAQAKNLIESERYQGKLIYAYAYGAVQSTQESYYTDMLPYITVEGSGRLLLLTGYYFEKKDEMPKAILFYKMAYEKNKTDVYNIFAYARALDIEQKIEAVTLYRDVLNNVGISHPLHVVTKKRISELGE